jgi:ATPase family AAA domain-containing protein 3A/B
MSEDQRNALNAFLYRTGTESRNFMVVYATNEPDQLDWAVTDRTDELVQFDLPQEPERKQIIRLYFDKFVKNAHLNAKKGLFGGAAQLTIDPEVTSDMVDRVAARTKGFSGRELAKLCIGWSAAAYSSANATLTKQMLERVLDEALEQHMSKAKWDTERV